MATPLTDTINALTTYANEVTGASDTNLSDAVHTLASGYGGGGGSVLTVTLTLTNNEWLPDKTFAEIQSAYNNGDTVEVIAYNESGGEYCQTSCRYYEESVPQTFEYRVAWFDFDDTGYLCLDTYGYTSNGVELYYRMTFSAPATLIEKTITANGTYNPIQTDYADGYSLVTVNVPGGAMNVQTNQSKTRRNNILLGTVNTLTCSTSGTYDVYWTCTRSSTSGSWGSQLYINGTAYGTENTTFTNHVQTNHLTGVTIPANATVAVYGRSESGYYIYAPQLTIVQTA